MSASAIRAGRAFVELFTKDDELRKGLAAAQKRVADFAKRVDAVGTSLLKVGVGVGAPLLLAAKTFADAGSELVDMSQRTGVAVEQLSALKFVADQAGTSLSGFENGVRRMQRSITDGGDVFAELGLDLVTLRRLAPDEQFLAIAEAISKVKDETRQASLAMEVFGRSGTALLPMMAGGAQGIRRGMGEAQSRGLVMSREDAEIAEKFGDAIDAATKSVKQIVIAVGAALNPALTELAEWLDKNMQGFVAWINNNREAIVTVAKLAAEAGVLGSALKIVAGALETVAIAVRGVKLGAVAIAAMGPWTILAGAIAGVVVYIEELTRATLTWRGVFAKFRADIESFDAFIAKVDKERLQRDADRAREELDATLAEVNDRLRRGGVPAGNQQVIDEAAKRREEQTRKELEAEREKNRVNGRTQEEINRELERRWGRPQGFSDQDVKAQRKEADQQAEQRQRDAEARRQKTFDQLARNFEEVVAAQQAREEEQAQRQRETQQLLERMPETLTAGSEAAAQAFLQNFRADSPAAKAAERQAKAAEEANATLKEVKGLLKGPLPVSCDGYNVGF